MKCLISVSIILRKDIPLNVTRCTNPNDPLSIFIVPQCPLPCVWMLQRWRSGIVAWLCKGRIFQAVRSKACSCPADTNKRPHRGQKVSKRHERSSCFRLQAPFTILPKYKNCGVPHPQSNKTICRDLSLKEWVGSVNEKQSTQVQGRVMIHQKSNYGTSYEQNLRRMQDMFKLKTINHK